jgi:hypothetical protein
MQYVLYVEVESDETAGADGKSVTLAPCVVRFGQIGPAAGDVGGVVHYDFVAEGADCAFARAGGDGSTSGEGCAAGDVSGETGVADVGVVSACGAENFAGLLAGIF